VVILLKYLNEWINAIYLTNISIHYFKKVDSSGGMDSGFHDDEAYNVYDRPFRQESSIANNIYRPSKNVDKDIFLKYTTFVSNLDKIKPCGPYFFRFFMRN
jgi:vesicle coat complex subunit